MLNLVNKIKNFFTPNILQVTEEGRLFILLRQLGLINKLEIIFTNPTFAKLRSFKKYHILIKVPQIESLADRNIIIDPKLTAIQRFNKRTTFIFDLSTEAITFTEYTSKILLSFHEILRDHHIPSKNIILICANANAELYYHEWLKSNNLEYYPINLLGYNFYLYEYFWETRRCEWLQKNHTTLINSSYETIEKNKKRDKYFICLNLRPRKHRTAIVLHLLQRGHINKGHVTYFGDEFAEHDSVDKESDRLKFIEKLSCKDRLIPYLENLKKITPLLLDRDSTKIKKDLWDRKPGSVEFLIPEGNDLATSGINSYFEIVTETWLTDQRNSYITEKTIRPILRLQPFIHVGSPYLLKQLREMGFQTFSPLIDESYDLINDPHLRLESIFNEIDRLCNMSIDEIHQLYCELWPRLLHNYNHFKNNLLNVAENEISQKILRRIQSNFTFRKEHA